MRIIDMIKVDDYTVYLEFLLGTKDHVYCMSIFDNVQQRVRAFAATVNLGNSYLSTQGETIGCTDRFDVYITPITKGKTRFYHALLINREISEKYLIIQNLGTDFYNWLMKKYSLPLLEWWGEPLLRLALENKMILKSPVKFMTGKYRQKGSGLFTDEAVEALSFYEIIKYDEFVLKEHIAYLFQKGEIWLSNKPQQKLDVTDMDSYFKRYGHTLVNALKKEIQPRVPMNGSCSSVALVTKRLFPQQAAMVNGALAHLRNNNYIFLIEGMGVGKVRR